MTVEDNPAEIVHVAHQMLQQAKEDTMAGLPVDLAPFEGHVRKFCDKIALLPEHERAPYADELQILITELTVLSQELTGKRDEIKSNLNSLSKKSQAQKAYSQIANMQKHSDDKRN